MMLSEEEKIRYVSGQGMWHTNSLNGKMPQINLSDGPHGLRSQEEGELHNNDSHTATCFPSACCSACSFDPELIGRMAAAIAEEAKEQGVSVVLGPGVNIKRSPLCGRNFEYFSEDPYLAGTLAAAYVTAMQSEGVGTSLKHFAGNSQETCRMTANSQIDERALREIYLTAFEICVKKAKPATVMASYNRLNGTGSCENRHLLTDILRREWGYQGCVVSDWGACVDLPACIEAGMDLEMPDSLGNHIADMKKALTDGRLSQQALDRAVSHIDALVESYPPQKKSARKEDHHRLAKEIAKESAVLLKNNGILPYQKGQKLLVVGQMAENIRIQGGGSSHIKTAPIVNLVQALSAAGADVIYTPGYPEEKTKRNQNWERKALELARKAKAENRRVLFCGGLTNATEGEGFDRTDFSMPENQSLLLRQLCAEDAQVVFLSFNGSPYDISPADSAAAILMMYLGGEAVAEAAADLLLGEANPCGRLAETWPLSLSDTPCFDSFGIRAPKLQDIEYRESIYVGYRYYQTFGVSVRYPFGWGLSYTMFSYDDLSAEKNADGTVSVSCTVKNTGHRFGKETVQLYVRNPNEDIARPLYELRGFQKIALEPEQTQTVRFVLEERAFSVFDPAQGRFRALTGTYELCIGASVSDLRLCQTIRIEGAKAEDGGFYLPAYRAGQGRPFSPTQEDFQKLYGRELSDFTHTKKGFYSMKNSLTDLTAVSRGARRLLRLARFAAGILMIGRGRDDPEVMMLMQGLTEGNLDSVVNQSGGLISYQRVQKLIEQANRREG